MNPRNERARGAAGAGGTVVWSDGRNLITRRTLHEALQAACGEVGVAYRDVPADGRWHKTDIDGDPRGRGDGRIKLFADGEGGAVYNWKGEQRVFFVDNGHALTETERYERDRRRAEAIRLAEEEKARSHAEAAKKAAAIWQAARPAPTDHAYLLKKGVKPYGVRVHEGSLVIPIRDGHELHSLQFIGPDGNKRFLTGGHVGGCYFPIGKPDGVLCVCEGYATGASIHEATGHAVAVAFSAGNLRTVAEALRARHSDAWLIVCGDHDESGTGQRAAHEAAEAVGGAVAIPIDVGDWNDVYRRQGPEAVRTAIAGAAASGEAADTAGSSTRTEPGLTDLGNARRFARDHGADVRYCWPWSKWLVWNGGFWSRDDTGEIHRLAETTIRRMYQEAAQSSPEWRKALGEWAVKCEAHERRVKMLASAQAISGIPIRPEDMDRDPWLLNVRNGTIDLRTGTLRPHAREDLITRGIDVDYDPDAVCPTWARFIREVFADNAETIAFVQRAVGYSLTGEVREHAFFIAHGAGSNGKSTLLGAVHDLLGAYAGRVPAELLMARRGEHHPTERATLYRKRFVSSSETGDGRRLAEDLVKSLTGGDPIECRRMREDFWEFQPTHKLWLATNHKPQIRGTDHAIWRRIHLIPFDVTFHEPETGKTPKKDPTLPGRLREELAGILRWAVKGCLAWQREGLKTPKTVRDATEGYRAEMDVLAAFFEERCVFDKQAEAGASDLYRAYTRWCEATGEHAESQTSFGARLRERGLTSHKGHTRKVWRGIGLKAADSADSADSVDPFSGYSHEKKTQGDKPENWCATVRTVRACPPSALPEGTFSGNEHLQHPGNDSDTQGPHPEDPHATAWKTRL